MVESTVVPNNTYFFVTNGELEYNVPFEKAWLREPEMDWYLAVGGGQNVLQSEVICEVIDGKKIYHDMNKGLKHIDINEVDFKEVQDSNLAESYQNAIIYYGYEDMTF